MESLDTKGFNAFLDENIIVTDAYGNLVPVTVTPGSDNKSAIAKPPVAGYTPGQEYTLHIKDTIKFVSGKYLKNPVKMQFTIETTTP